MPNISKLFLSCTNSHDFSAEIVQKSRGLITRANSYIGIISICILVFPLSNRYGVVCPRKRYCGSNKRRSRGRCGDRHGTG